MDASGLGGQFSSSPVSGLLDHHCHMNLLGRHDNGRQQIPTNFSKGKSISPFSATNNYNMSEDDEPCFMEDGNGEKYSSEAKSTKGSLWQRMKWTDEIVKLLIAVVTCVGDDVAVDDVEGRKRKSGILQKKGKWKRVSKIMIGKGCHVSPQQCEDKFNDLNKRYKRLNEILGRGISCRVVENPSLMDSMPRLSSKAKDDVRKILSSKHLFYKEMCAYHNGQRIPDCHDINLQECSLPLEKCVKDNNGSEDSDEDDESDNEDGGRKNEVEMVRIFQDPSVSLWEKTEWIKRQKLELLEQRVRIQTEAFELEKQRCKWLRYCNKKDREFERLRLENERMRLGNEQSILHMRQKQLEMDIRSSET